jgi:hypothetical protein
LMAAREGVKAAREKFDPVSPSPAISEHCRPVIAGGRSGIRASPPDRKPGDLFATPG